MKANSTPTENILPVRRINAIVLCLVVFVLSGLVTGWLVWQQRIGGDLAWGIQSLSAVILIGLIAALYSVHRKTLAEPIRRIADWASNIRQGDFSARLDTRHGGLHRLTDDINRMAEWLESLAEMKDQELREQSARLKTQTHILHLLYDISGKFSQNATANELINQTIQPMVEVLDAYRIEFYTFNGDDGKPTRIAAHSNPGSPADPAGIQPAGIQPAGIQHIKIPLQFSKKVYGECQIWFADERFPLPDEFSQLLYTLGRNIGMALEKFDLHKESVRLSRMQERTHLANELHDSLAQTIASLRFQVRILDDLLHQQEEHAVWEQLEKVENMLEGANAELRSLIGYFRAPIDPGGLLPAIKAVVARFRSEVKISLYFQNQWGQVNIPEKWQLEIIRIIQEALSNIRKHSGAQNARVLLRVDKAERYTVLIEDDGVGMTVMPGTGNNPGEHIGLSVMAQRARTIDADFQIESEPGEGTRILLSFRLAIK